jgi:hypothetical protein
LSGGPLIVLIVLTLAVMAAAWFLPARRAPLPDGEGGAAGAALLLLALAALTQAIEPTAAPLLQWPLLLGALAMAARAFLPTAWALVVGLLCAVAGVGHLLAEAHFIYLAIGAAMPGLTMVLLFAALPLVLPLWPERIPRWMPGTALAAALVLALWVRLDPMAPSVPRYSLHHGGKTRD